MGTVEPSFFVEFGFRVFFDFSNFSFLIGVGLGKTRTGLFWDDKSVPPLFPVDSGTKLKRMVTPTDTYVGRAVTAADLTGKSLK